MVRWEREGFNKMVFQDISVWMETHRNEPPDAKPTHMLQTYCMNLLYDCTETQRKYRTTCPHREIISAGTFALLHVFLSPSNGNKVESKGKSIKTMPGFSAVMLSLSETSNKVLTLCGSKDTIIWLQPGKPLPQV